MKALALLSLSIPMLAQDAKLLHWMDGIAQRQLRERRDKIGQIRNAAAAESRKQFVRAKILELIGGLPDYNGPLRARVTGVLRRDGYEIRKALYESLPGIFITANVYVPSTPGAHPAVLLPLGHWEQGKSAVQLVAANLALRGFVVLAYDPIGQGERQQAYDRRSGKSLAGGPTEQHFMLGAVTLLAGQSFARYRIWDAKRSLDYLVSLPEVDRARVGVTGCSGGGTIATYIAALDDRIQVAAPACYMNSFATLFPGDVGDSEQSLPNFLANGLDQADYVELFAPKPWLIASTEGDFFTPAGAKQVFEEARGWYSLWGAQEKIRWIVGPGPHGTPRVVRQAIYDWMEQWLQPGRAHSPEAAVATSPDHELWAAPDGQVANLPGSRDLYLFIRESLKPHAARSAMMQELRRLLEIENREHPDSDALRALLVNTESGITSITVEPERRIPRLSGNWLPNTRMWLIGHNLPMAQVANILRHINGPVQLHASGEAGVWALIAAALDPRIERVSLDHTPFSLRAAFDSPVHDNLHDAVIPGFAKNWDLDDLVAEIGADRIVWTDPTDWTRNIVRVKAPFVRYRTADIN